MTQEAYSHEVSSCGVWPGDASTGGPAFYAYAYPEPPGFAAARVRPDAALYSREKGEFLLPYDAVRRAAAPEGDLLAFLQDTYATAAELGRWDCGALEREPVGKAPCRPIAAPSQEVAMAEHDRIRGLHHVTAIAGGAQANLDFYTDVLGLRLVKRTVNFDAPDTYHFYFGDAAGRPGSLLTFFPFENAAPGRTGPGMVETTAFAVPEAAFEPWMARLAEAGRDFHGPTTRFGERVLGLRDPDGLRIELVAPRLAWTVGAGDGQAAQCRLSTRSAVSTR